MESGVSESGGNEEIESAVLWNGDGGGRGHSRDHGLGHGVGGAPFPLSASDPGDALSNGPDDGLLSGPGDDLWSDLDSDPYLCPCLHP